MTTHAARISLALLVAFAFFSPAPSALAWNCLGGNGGGCGGPGELDFTPRLSITAVPASITEGQSTYVSWSGTWVTDCSTDFSYTSDWVNSGGLVGGYTTDYPSHTRTYTVTCTGNDNTGTNPHPVSASATVTVTPASGVELTAGAVSPTLVTGGFSSAVSAQVSNIGTVGTSRGFPTLFQWTGTEDGSLGAFDMGTAVRADPLSASSNFTATYSYVFPAVASQSFLYVRACADKAAGTDATGVIAETNEGNNCGAWTRITIAPSALQCSDASDNDGDGAIDTADPQCTGPGDATEGPDPIAASLSASPASVTTGRSSTLTWSSTNASSCTGTGFATGGATSGSVSTGALTVSTNYSVNCSGAVANAGVTVTNPTATISANPTRVKAGAHSSLTWSTSACGSVSVTGTNGFSSTASSSANVDSGAIGTHGDTFTVNCDSGAAVANIQVNVPPQFDEF